jgi:hypothetical protein
VGYNSLSFVGSLLSVNLSVTESENPFVNDLTASLKELSG